MFTSSTANLPSASTFTSSTLAITTHCPSWFIPATLNFFRSGYLFCIFRDVHSVVEQTPRNTVLFTYVFPLLPLVLKGFHLLQGFDNSRINVHIITSHTVIQRLS